MKTLLLSALLLLPGLCAARESSTDIEVTIAPAARPILKRNRAAFVDGLLTPRSGKPTDLTSGGGALYIAPHPVEKDHLAIAAYQHGKRYAAFEVWVEGEQVAVTPLSVPEEKQSELFPAKLGRPDARYAVVSGQAREAMVDRGYVLENGVLKPKGAAKGFKLESLQGKGRLGVERKGGSADQVYVARYEMDRFLDGAVVTLAPGGPKVEKLKTPSDEMKRLFSPEP